jgi:aminoglycoside phosphotransferase (APT) family kinase protein
LPGQFALLNILEKTAIKVPPPLWLEADESILGQAFLTMQPVGGVTGTRLIPLEDPLFDAKLASYVDALATIHGLDWRGIGIDTVLPVPANGDSTQAELDIEFARMERMGHGANPVAVRAAAWLKERKPASSEVALIHGDCNMANYRFGEDGAVVAVLDWEAARLSDPLWDVANYVRMIPRYYKDETPAIQQRERERFLSLYTQATGRSMEHLDYWEALFAFSSGMKSEHPAFAANWSPIYWDQVSLLTGGMAQ